MRITIGLLLAAIVGLALTSPASAERGDMDGRWMEFTVSESGDTWYVDMTSTKSALNSPSPKKEFWTRIVEPNGEYGISRQILDCSERTIEHVSVTLFNANGKALTDSSGIPGRKPLKPGTNGAELGRFICGDPS